MRGRSRDRWQPQSETTVKSRAGECTIEVWCNPKDRGWVATVNGTWGPLLDNSGTGRQEDVVIDESDMIKYGSNYGDLLLSRLSKAYTGALRLAPGSPPNRS